MTQVAVTLEEMLNVILAVSTDIGDLTARRTRNRRRNYRPHQRNQAIVEVAVREVEAEAKHLEEIVGYHER